MVNDQVFFDSAQRVNLTPQQRKTALLFQSYMLFPNLTVAENVGAGIEPAVPRGVRDAIVATELKRFGLEGFDKMCIRDSPCGSATPAGSATFCTATWERRCASTRRWPTSSPRGR